MEQKLIRLDQTTEGATLRHFFSRKNSVSLLTANHNGQIIYYIEKVFTGGQKAVKTEEQILEVLSHSNLPVPKVLYRNNGSLFIEYIPGVTLLDVYCFEETKNYKGSLDASTIAVIEQLSSWLIRFYSITKEEFGTQMILGDPNFRNFMLSDKLFGIDFEEVKEGRIEDDLALLCAYSLTYDPPFTDWKRLFTDCLVSKLAKEIQLDKNYLGIAVESKVNDLVLMRSCKNVY